MSKTTARKPVRKHPASKSAPAAKAKAPLTRKAAAPAKAKPAVKKAAKPAAKASASIPRHEFMAALAELRDDVEDETALFPVAEIKARVMARRTLAANTEAASH